MTSSAAAPFLSHFPETGPVHEPAVKRWVRWALVFGAWTAYGLAQGVLYKVTFGPGLSWRWAMEISIGVAWFWAVLTPAIAWIQRRVEDAHLGKVGAFGAHAAIAPAIALLVTLARRELTTAFSPLEIGPVLPNYVYWLDVNVLTYATVVAATWALGLHRQYRDRTVRTHMLEVQLARAQLQFLGLQLQPHFLFNCLNAISELAHEAPEAAERMLRQLHTLLRLSLERAGQDEVTLEEELASLEPYFEIQRARFSEWLTVALEVQPGARLALVPHLILQPLVENAIRHGLAVRSAPGTVGVKAWVTDSRLHLEVADNGVGLAPTRTSFRPGIGLRNAKNRLTQLYGDDHRFELRSGEDGGTVVSLEIPYRSRALLADQPPPDWSATGEWSMMPPQRLWSTPAAGTPVAGQSVGAAVAQSRWNGLEASEVFGDAPPVTTAPVPELVAQTNDAPDAAASLGETAVRPGRESPRLSGRVWLAIAGIWAGCAVLWSLQVYYFAAALGLPTDGTEIQFVLAHLVSAAAWALVTPLVLLLARRLRIGRRNWRSRIVVHAVLAGVLATVHVAIVRATGLMGDFGLFSSLSFNQISGNIFIYFALLAWSHGRDFYAWYRERDLAAARLESAIARSRYQTLCVQLRPQFLLGTIELLARLVHEDVNRTERLIARLADVLRLTLDAAGERETSLRRELELVRAYVDVHDLGIRPGTALAVHVAPETLSVRLPNRLLRTLIDDLLAGTNGGTVVPEQVSVTVDSERLVGGATRVRVHAATPDGEPADAGRPGGWAEAVEKATLAERDRKVSLYFPDSMTAIVLLADRDTEASRDAVPAALSAQPA